MNVPSGDHHVEVLGHAHLNPFLFSRLSNNLRWKTVGVVELYERFRWNLRNPLFLQSPSYSSDERASPLEGFPELVPFHGKDFQDLIPHFP